MIGWGSGGCEPQIEDIIKLKRSGSGWWRSSRGVRSGRGFDECEPRIESIVKRAYRYFTINKSKKYGNGGPQPSRVIKTERNLKEIWKNCVPLSGLNPGPSD